MMHEDHSGAADEAQAFATLLVVSMCFFSKENEKFSADAPQVQEDGVEAVQSPPPPPPKERGLDVAEPRVDARMPRRSTASHIYNFTHCSPHVRVVYGREILPFCFPFTVKEKKNQTPKLRITETLGRRKARFSHGVFDCSFCW